MSIFKRTKIIDCSDEQLIAQIERGNESAFNLLYERYSTKLFRYFFRLLGNDAAQAEDFLQELFIKVLNNAHSFSANHKASTWLYTIATNMCKNEWRNTENRQRLMRHFDAWEHPSKSVYEQMESKQLSNLVDKMMSQLDEDDQLIIHLRFQQELPIKAIAAILDIPEGTVKSKLFYLLRKIAAQLKTNPII